MTTQGKVMLAMCAALAVFATHYQVTHLELRADDYAILRPWSALEIREAIGGTWSGTRGFQEQYHRPLAGLYHSALFAVFGMNAPALHWLSLIELAVVVWMLALYLWREAGAAAAIGGAAVYLLNPLLRDSTSAWIFNQFHLLACMIVLASLLIWQRYRRSSSPDVWLPLIGLAAAGWFVKEDTIMVMPALLLCQVLRARTPSGGGVPMPQPRTFAAAAALFAGVLSLRFALLSPFRALQAREPLTMAERAMSIAYAVGRPFFARVHGHIAPAGTLLLVALAVAALAGIAAKLARRLNRLSEDARLAVTGAEHADDAGARAAALAVDGAVLLGAFALPLMLQPALGTTRVHLVLLSSSLITAGGCAIVWRWISQRGVTAIAAACVAAAAGAWSLQSAALGAQFDLYSPCSRAQLAADADVQGWEIVSADVRAWLADKTQQCRSGAASNIRADRPLIHWHTSSGWTLLASVDSRTASFIVSDATASAEHPREVTIESGDVITHATLRGPEPIKVTRVLHGSVVSWLRQAHRIDITASEAGSLTVR